MRQSNDRSAFASRHFPLGRHFAALRAANFELRTENFKLRTLVVPRVYDEPSGAFGSRYVIVPFVTNHGDP